MGMQWYIIHTYSGFEKKVKESLESRVEAFNLQDKIGHVAIAADRGRSGRHYQPRAYAAGPPETESGFRAQRAGAHRGWPVCEFQRQRRRNRQRSQPFEGFGDDFWTLGSGRAGFCKRRKAGVSRAARENKKEIEAGTWQRRFRPPSSCNCPRAKPLRRRRSAPRSARMA